jgi:hypothetical protein
MNNLTTLARKYRQAPWRTQRQWLGLVLLGVVMVAMVASVYLNVTARGSLAGREILTLTDAIAVNERANADLQTQLAETGSEMTMQQHAQALGFLPADPADIVYVVVPGYVRKSGVDLSTTHEEPAASIILPEYRQTLFEWFAEYIQTQTPMTGGQP